MLAMENVQVISDVTSLSDFELQEVSAHVKLILMSIRGTVPLARGDGMDGSIIDLPIDIAKSRYTVEAIKNISKYENRVSVEEISFTYNENTDQLIPKVVITDAE